MLIPVPKSKYRIIYLFDVNTQVFSQLLKVKPLYFWQ